MGTYDIFVRKGRPGQKHHQTSIRTEIEGIDYWQALVRPIEEGFGTIDEYVIMEGNRAIMWWHPEIQFMRDQAVYASGIKNGELEIQELDSTTWEKFCRFADDLIGKIPSYYTQNEERENIVTKLIARYNGETDVKNHAYNWLTATEERRNKLPLALDHDDFLTVLCKGIVGRKEVPSYMPKKIGAERRPTRAIQISGIINTEDVLGKIRKINREY